MDITGRMPPAPLSQHSPSVRGTWGGAVNDVDRGRRHTSSRLGKDRGCHRRNERKGDQETETRGETARHLAHCKANGPLQHYRQPFGFSRSGESQPLCRILDPLSNLDPRLWDRHPSP